MYEFVPFFMIPWEYVVAAFVAGAASGGALTYLLRRPAALPPPAPNTALLERQVALLEEELAELRRSTERIEEEHEFRRALESPLPNPRADQRL